MLNFIDISQIRAVQRRQRNFADSRFDYSYKTCSFSHFQSTPRFTTDGYVKVTLGLVPGPGISQLLRLVRGPSGLRIHVPRLEILLLADAYRNQMETLTSCLYQYYTLSRVSLCRWWKIPAPGSHPTNWTSCSCPSRRPSLRLCASLGAQGWDWQSARCW